jgi:hypothetical protein
VRNSPSPKEKSHYTEDLHSPNPKKNLVRNPPSPKRKEKSHYTEDLHSSKPKQKLGEKFTKKKEPLYRGLDEKFLHHRGQPLHLGLLF